MSGQITLWGASHLLTNSFSRTTTAPLSYYLALCPSVAGTAFINASELVEVSGGGYARVAIPNDSTAWALNTFQNAVANIAGITFPAATASWGNIRYWALCDSSTGGNVWFTGSFDTPLKVNTGDIATIAPGNLALGVGLLSSETAN